MELVNYRTLDLKKNKLAVISEDSNGWFLTNQKDFLKIKTALEQKRKFPIDLKRKLFESGLLKIDNKPIEISVKEKTKGPNSLLLKLTGACNLHCDYCYDYDLKRWKTNLSIDKVKEAIEYLDSINDNFGIVFHGGEPLLRFNLIKEVVEYVKLLGLKGIKYSIQTNAALLTDEIVAFLEKYNFNVGISIDGHTETANRLRTTKSRKSALDFFLIALEKYPDFIKNRCGILAVVSKSNVKELPSFAVWLQNKGIYGLGLSFMDKAGKGINIPEEKVSESDAIQLYNSFFELIENGTIDKLNISTLTSKISNLFQFQPKDFCHKGPCAAFDDFLVLDSENLYRTCDSVYHPFFEIGKNLEDSKESKARKNILDRHLWLKHESLSCSTCPIISFCGGTCAAKAIASNGNPFSIDRIECTLSKLIYPKLLNEYDNNNSSPLIEYYLAHKR